MRSTIRSLLPLLIVLALIVSIIAAMTMHARSDNYDEIVRDLYSLERDHVAVAKEVLAARYAGSLDYNLLVLSRDQLVKSASFLQINDKEIVSRSDPRLSAELKQYANCLDSMLQHIEDFKTANAIEHNSIRYLPVIAGKVTDAAGPADLATLIALQRTLQDVMLYAVEGKSSSRAELVSRLDDLHRQRSTAAAALIPSLALLEQHVAKILETQPLVERNIDAILSSPTNQLLAETLKRVTADNETALRIQQILQTALIVVGATYLGYVIAIFWQLRCAVRELDTANLVLEDEIAERVAELKARSQQLFQAQKLESIGQLAAGIAHEINTPMQFVQDNTEYLKDCFHKLLDNIFAVFNRSIDPSSQGRAWSERWNDIQRVLADNKYERISREIPKAIDESLEGINRVVCIVRAMKELSYVGTEQKVALDLNNAVESSITITRGRWKYTAEIEVKLEPNLPPLMCVPTEINQVLLNLIVNASDAIGEKVDRRTGVKGKIKIRTRRVDGHLVLEVEDTGCGIPESIRLRIFDPFFTTKEVGKGTGQGLAICHRIVVSKYQGTMEVESTPNIGTLFRVALPLTQVNGAAFENEDSDLDYHDDLAAAKSSGRHVEANLASG